MTDSEIKEFLAKNMTDERLRSLERREEALRRLQDPPNTIRMPDGRRLRLGEVTHQPIYSTVSSYPNNNDLRGAPVPNRARPAPPNRHQRRAAARRSR